MKHQEKLEIFHATFIQYCLEAIERERKIMAGINVANEPSYIEKAFYLCAKLPILAFPANIVIVTDQFWRNVREYGSTERITRIFSADSDEQITQTLLMSIREITGSSSFKTTLENTDDRQKIINFAALAKNKLFAHLRENTLTEDRLTQEAIVGIIQKKNTWFSSDVFSPMENNKHKIEQVQDFIDVSVEKAYKKPKLNNEAYNLIHDNSDNNIHELDDINADHRNNNEQLIQEINHFPEYKSSSGYASSSSSSSSANYFYNIQEAVHCFTGRDEDLIIIQQYFSQNINGVQIIGGLGGIGKTQTALKYISEHKHEYEHRVRYFSAENENALDLAFREFAQDLGHSIDNKSGGEILKLITRDLASRIDHSLLFFDNVVDFELIKKYLPSLGAPKQHHVIITTQNIKDHDDSSIFTNINIIKLEPFTTENSLRFIKNSLNNVNEQDGLILAELFGNIPLGIAQSISYIKIHNIDIDVYLAEHKLFKDKHPSQLPEILHSAKFDPHKENIYVTISMSIEQLSNVDPKALELLKLCSYLNSNNIPDYLFNHISIFTSNSERNKAVSTLEGYSLVSVTLRTNSKYLSIHKLLQEVIRIKIINEPHIVLQQAITLVHEQIIDKNNEVLMLQKQQLLLIHAVSLIKHYNSLTDSFKHKAIEDGLSKCIAELHNDCGNVYFVLLQLNMAQEQYERALNIYTSIYGDNPHQKIATIMNNLGAVHQILGNAQAMLQSHQQALAIYKILYGDDHSKIALTLRKIGYAYIVLKQPEESLVQYNQALQIFERIHANQDIAETIRSIGYVYSISQEYDKALEKYNLALEIIKNIHGDKSPQAGDTEHAIGKFYLAWEKNENALEHFNKALEINKSIYGNEHYIIASNIRGAGKVLQAIGDNQKALNKYQEVANIFKNLFGEKHFLVGNIMCAIGYIYKMQTQYNDALASYNQALEIYITTYGNEHYNVAKILNNIENINNALVHTEVFAMHFQPALTLKRQSSTGSQVVTQLSDSWIDLIENIEESPNSQLTQVSPPPAAPPHAVMYYITDIKYDNPLLRPDILPQLVQNFGILKGEIFSKLLELGNDIEIADVLIDAIKEHGIKHVIKIIFGHCKEPLKIDDRLPYIDQQATYQFNHLTIAAFTIKECLEALPMLNYFFRDIMHLPFCLPKILENNYIKIAVHCISCNIGIYSIFGNFDFTRSALSTAIYSTKLFVYEYLNNQKLQNAIIIDTPMKFIEKCGFDMSAQAILGGLSAFITGVPVFYDIAISTTVGGLQCYNTYNKITKLSQTIYNIETLAPYAVDLLTLYAVTRNIHFDLTTQIGQMIAVKQSLNVINSVVIADYITKITIANLQEGYFDYINNIAGEIHDYFY